MNKDMKNAIPEDQCFLVGGFVRDFLLNEPQKDKDYVVVGMTQEDMLAKGFQQVGKQFPVFLDQDGVEFALARQERKTHQGYHGFQVVTDNVTLQEDLFRRDLTINAMAQDCEGRIIDPFGGQNDIRNRILRHVSEAFQEDPVRVLRVARFAARYAHLGFTVADETIDLMRSMVRNGEVDSLTPERIWLEFTKATQTQNPSTFLRVLRECGALEKIMPEVNALYGVPQNPLYHPEVDTGIHTEMVLDQACRIAPNNLRVAYAAMCHDLGKGITPKDQWPKHISHEENGIPLVKTLSARLKTPTDCQDLALKSCEHHLRAHRCLESRPGSLYHLIMDVGLRQESQFRDFLDVCEADKKGRTGLEHEPYPQKDLLMACFRACKSVSGLPFVGMEPHVIKEKMRLARIKAIHQAKGAYFHACANKTSETLETSNVKSLKI